MKKKLLWPMACMAFLLVSCATVPRLAYNNSPLLATWYVDDYFDLTDGQRDVVRTRFERLLAWHRKAELPEIRGVLGEAHDKIGGEFSVADTERIYLKARASYERTVLRALPDMSEFVTTVTPEQVATLEKKLATANEKLDKDVAKPTRSNDRAKRLQEQFTDWAGSITPAQKVEIKNAVDRWPSIDKGWIADRKFRQQETIRLMKSKPSPEAANQAIRRLLLAQDSWRSPEYVKLLKERERLSIELFAKLLSSLTPDQQTALKRKLKSYEGDVLALMLVS